MSTPYAANEDEASILRSPTKDVKDYELDRLERNREIINSEQMNPSYECPQCNEWIEIVPLKEKGTFRCLYCGEVLRLDVDGEFEDGLWHDRSKLVTAGSHWDE